MASPIEITENPARICAALFSAVKDALSIPLATEALNFVFDTGIFILL
jgi:hypothetical protein